MMNAELSRLRFFDCDCRTVLELGSSSSSSSTGIGASWVPFEASVLNKGDVFVVAERVVEELRREHEALVRVGVWKDIPEDLREDG